jgi:uncharacterized membrane protein SpoIIM required for sporulation
MKETRFIAQNKEKWLESESLLRNPAKDPEKLSTLFTQVVDDLSYSRTYYPNRSVRVYLNKIARQYFSIIYSQKKQGGRSRFMMFWLDELPQIIIYCKKQLLISLFIFVAAMMIGVFSAYKDPDFVGTILSEDYVTMTQENIAAGDPMAVYKQSHQVDMFLGITLNNLMVAFRTYVFGIFMAIGTLVILLYNGVMVGCFQFFFIERGLFAESALTIWLHGTLEISSIVIAGGAGLTLGSGLLFPGTYSRLQAFQLSAMRSLKLMLGISPIIVLAGVIESFLTRYTEVPDFLRLLLILLSAAFIIGYFVIYPWRKSRQGFAEPLKEVRLHPTNREPLSYTRVKNNAEIVKDAFRLYAHRFSALLPWIVIVALISTTSAFLRYDTEVAAPDDQWLATWFITMTYALHTPSPIFILINAFCLSAIVYRVMKLVASDASHSGFRWDVNAMLSVLLMSAMLFGLIYLGAWGIVAAIGAFGFILLACYVVVAEKENLATVWGRTWSLFGAYNKLVWEWQLMILLLSISFLLVLSAPLLYIYTSFLQMNFAETDGWAQEVIRFVILFIRVVSFYLIVPLLAAGMAYLYYTLREIKTASHLKESIAQVGMRNTKNYRA